MADDEERVIGFVALDNLDQDWSWMVLGRDEAGLFRSIDVGVSLPSQEEARKWLTTKLKEYSVTKKTIFPQCDVTRKSIDMFKPVVNIALLHPNFRLLTNGVRYSSARGILEELARAFIDVDGNFLKDFQTTGFNARLWELHLMDFFTSRNVSWFVISTVLILRREEWGFNRYRSGNDVKWETAFRTLEGSETYKITGNRSNLKRFTIGTVSKTIDDRTGTTVTISEITSSLGTITENGNGKDRLTELFALYLRDYPMRESS